MDLHWSILLVAFSVVCIVAEAAVSVERTPHYLYMKRLREHLSYSNIALPNFSASDSVQGKLMATSIEAYAATGIGMQHIQWYLIYYGAWHSE